MHWDSLHSVSFKGFAMMGLMFDDRLSTIAMDFSMLLFRFFQVLATKVKLRNYDMWAISSRDEIKQKCHEIESIISLSLKTHHNFLSKVLPWVIGHQAMPYPAHNKYSKNILDTFPATIRLFCSVSYNKLDQVYLACRTQ